MKKLIVNIAVILGVILGSMIISSFTSFESENSIISISSTKGPQFDGTRFESKYGETLDFYKDFNKVVYHAEGSPVSRTGDYKIGGISETVHGVGEENRYITINISVAGRIQTLKGDFTYKTSTGEITRLKLDGQIWKRVI